MRALLGFGAAAPQEYAIGRRRLVEERPLSEGGFSFVVQVRDVRTGDRFALKKILCQDEEGFAAAKREVDILEHLPSHKNIVEYFGHKVVKTAERGSARQVLILLELCPGGHLLDLLDRHKGILPESEIVRAYTDIAEALFCLHSHSPPIQHRDLKLENVLLGSDNCWKIVDFGSWSDAVVDLAGLAHGRLAAMSEELERYTTMIYRPPEFADVYLRLPVSCAVDIWMLGCVLFTLMYNKHPFQDATNFAIREARYALPPRSPTLAAKLVDLLVWCLAPDPRHRPNARKIVTMLWQWSDLAALALPISVAERRNELLAVAAGLRPGAAGRRNTRAKPGRGGLYGQAGGAAATAEIAAKTVEPWVASFADDFTCDSFQRADGPQTPVPHVVSPEAFADFQRAEEFQAEENTAAEPSRAPDAHRKPCAIEPSASPVAAPAEAATSGEASKSAAQLPQAVRETLMAQGSTLRVRVEGFVGLSSADLDGTPDFYCMCQVQRRAETRFQTRSAPGCWSPAWGEEHLIADYVIEAPLHFVVMNREQQPDIDDLLVGKVELPSASFCLPQGFEGELPLAPGASRAGQAAGTLRLSVLPLEADAAVSVSGASEVAEVVTSEGSAKASLAPQKLEAMSAMVSEVDVANAAKEPILQSSDALTATPMLEATGAVTQPEGVIANAANDSTALAAERKSAPQEMEAMVVTSTKESGTNGAQVCNSLAPETSAAPQVLEVAGASPLEGVIASADLVARTSEKLPVWQGMPAVAATSTKDGVMNVTQAIGAPAPETPAAPQELEAAGATPMEDEAASSAQDLIALAPETLPAQQVSEAMAVESIDGGLTNAAQVPNPLVPETIAAPQMPEIAGASPLQGVIASADQDSIVRASETLPALQEMEAPTAASINGAVTDATQVSSALASETSAAPEVFEAATAAATGGEGTNVSQGLVSSSRGTLTAPQVLEATDAASAQSGAKKATQAANSQTSETPAIPQSVEGTGATLESGLQAPPASEAAQEGEATNAGDEVAVAVETSAH